MATQGLIPLPGGLSFDDWWPYVVEAYALEGVPQSGRWQDCVEAAMGYDDFPDVQQPDPEGDWLLWAESAMLVLI